MTVVNCERRFAGLTRERVHVWDDGLANRQPLLKRLTQFEQPQSEVVAAVFIDAHVLARLKRCQDARHATFVHPQPAAQLQHADRSGFSQRIKDGHRFEQRSQLLRHRKGSCMMNDVIFVSHYMQHYRTWQVHSYA